MQELVGAERFRASIQQKSVASLSKAERMIERANAVSIFDVLEDFFGLSLPRSGESYKSYCPWRAEHPDGGLDKGFRTYPGTNTAMCFPMHGFLTPVRLLQEKYQERPYKAAERILRNYDMLRPKPWQERYWELKDEAEESRDLVGNPQHAVEALSVALNGVPGYASRQYDRDVLDAMEAVLDRLNEVVVSGDPQQVRNWYDQAKAIMFKIVERTPR